jgi:hypothetical protein
VGGPLPEVLVDVLSFLEGDQRDGVVVASGVVVEVDCLAGREEGLEC